MFTYQQGACQLPFTDAAKFSTNGVLVAIAETW
jgi:hypothetical protein